MGAEAGVKTLVTNRSVIFISVDTVIDSNGTTTVSVRLVVDRRRISDLVSPQANGGWQQNSSN